MNVEKSNVNSYVYTLVLDCFYAIMVNFEYKFSLQVIQWRKVNYGSYREWFFGQ